jgi:LPS-assembly protein
MDERPSMTARIRFLITAWFLCQLLLSPVVLTTRLHAAQVPQQNALAAEPQSTPGAQNGSSPGSSTSSIPQNTGARPPKATTDTGAEDIDTEQIIQQEMISDSGSDQGPPRPATNIPLGRNEVLIRADEQEKNQDLYHVRGNVEIRFGTYILNCDEATYDSTTGIIKATGHVVFQGGPRNEHVEGSRATYDVSRDTGTFYDATGSLGARIKNHTMFLTSSTPFFFKGQEVDKLGPDLYRVNHGYVTSCQLPKPKWVLDSKTANVEVGDEAVMHHATLKVGGIPVFYFPFIEHPADNLGRKSGFLIPEIGSSNTRGTIFGDGFYWAMTRNADATIGAALYSKRGWAQTADIRAIGYTYGFAANYFGVIDSQGYPGTGQNQGGQELKVNAFKQLPDDWRGVLSADYLSSYLFRLAFAQGFTEAINSEVRSYGFVFKATNGYGFGLLASSYRNYESITPGDYIEIVHAPSLELSTVERPFSRNNFVYSYDVALEGVSRNEPGFETAPLVGRIDAAPYLAWPKLFHGWTLRPQIGVRETYYTQRFEATANALGQAVNDPINRNVGNASFDLRPPTLSKIFDKKLFGHVVKHTIEPFATYRYQTGISDFSQIIRFDLRDILADTNEVEYGVVNRLYAKKSSLAAKCFENQPHLSLSQDLSQRLTAAEKACEDKSGPSGEVITWELAQKYYGNSNFGGALVPGQRNVFDVTEDLTGIAFLIEPRHFSPIISRLRVQSGPADFQWALDYDPVLGHLNASTIIFGYRLGNYYLNGGQSYINSPGEATVTSGGVATPSIYNQYRVGLTYGALTRQGLSAGFSLSVDSRLSYVQSAVVQANYNWDCCGIAAEYARWEFPGVRDENAFRFTFSLSNVGSFGTLRRLSRIY